MGVTTELPVIVWLCPRCRAIFEAGWPEEPLPGLMRAPVRCERCGWTGRVYWHGLEHAEAARRRAEMRRTARLMRRLLRRGIADPEAARVAATAARRLPEMARAETAGLGPEAEPKAETVRESE
jgi:hypothetical protein